MKEKTVNQCPVIIGGIVMDFRGQPNRLLHLATSNPGKIRQYPGGVGRNIAENLFRLGLTPLIISAVGADLLGDSLLSHIKQLGLSCEGIFKFSDQRTAIYQAILDQGGDLHTAIADMDIFTQITPKQINSFFVNIIKAPIVIADTNLPIESLDYLSKLCHENNIPLWIEPVSVKKSLKIIDFMDRITYLSPNLDELAAITQDLTQLSESKIDSDTEIKQAAESLLAKGLKRLLITLGKDGVIYADKQSFRHFAALPAQIIDVTGAGDAFVAGTVYGLIQGLPIVKSIMAGLITAKLTIETKETVAKNLDAQLIKQIMLEVV